GGWLVLSLKGRLAQSGMARNGKSFDDRLLEDDGSLDLALMVTEHPAVKSCGQAMLETIREVNDLIQRCGPWIKSGEFQAEATIEANKSVLKALNKAQNGMQKLDDIDLDSLKPEWGDRDSVRMARKSVIGCAQAMMSRLESLKQHLAPPAAKFASQLGSQRQDTTFYGWALDGMEVAEAAAADVKPGEERSERCERSRSRDKGKGEQRTDSENSEERKMNRDTPHFQWTKGMKLGTGRYVVKRKVGEGSFGRVLACLDESSKQTVAVKVVKG
ncbi:unnamed protein product, partial [Effrenium voratum]